MPEKNYPELESFEKSALKTLVSVGCSYTTPENNRNDIWRDDGIRLTDGVQAPSNGANDKYSGFQADSGDFIVDLGNEYSLCAISTAMCAGMWGIEKPVSVTFSVSSDGESWNDVGTVSTDDAKHSSYEGWTRYEYTIDCSHFEGRFIKYSIISVNFIWIDELSVYSRQDVHALFVNAIDGITMYCEGNNPSLGGEGQGAIRTDMFAGATAGTTWCRIAVFEPSLTDDEYVITAIYIDDGNPKPEIVVPFEGFVYMVNTGNDWPALYASDPGKYSYAKNYTDYTSDEIDLSFELIASLEVGTHVILHEINLVYGTLVENFGSCLIIVTDD
ncbi:MAG TPA: hypothetical protein PLT66_06860 [Bacillota bacterium]|nr:hypothetical protein [Bacillota bacterium]